MAFIFCTLCLSMMLQGVLGRFFSRSCLEENFLSGSQISKMTCQNVIWLRNVHGCIRAFASISVWHFRIVLLLCQSKSQDLLQCIAEVLYLQKYVKKLSHKEYCEEKGEIQYVASATMSLFLQEKNVFFTRKKGNYVCYGIVQHWYIQKPLHDAVGYRCTNVGTSYAHELC